MTEQQKYKKTFSHLDVSSEFLTRIEEMDDMNNSKVRRMSLAKVAAIVIACIVAAGGTAYAAGVITGSIGWSWSFHDYPNYEDKAALEAKVGYEFIAPESFENGYTFDGFSSGGTADIDDEGNEYNNREKVTADYIKDGSPSMTLSIEETSPNAGYRDSDTEVRTIDGIEIHYNLDTYLFVPADYEVSEEDLTRAETDPHFFISDGVDEVSYEEVKIVGFEYNGLTYCLLTYNNENLSEDTMFEMASEIIEQ